MSSSFNQNLLSPGMQNRVESLFKPSYQFLDDPWHDSFPGLGSYLSKGKEISCKSVNNFHLYMNVYQFKPCDIDVKIVDGFILVEAKHDQNLSSSSREFKRQYKLPEDIDPSSLNFAFNEKGLLVVKTNRRNVKTEENDELKDKCENDASPTTNRGKDGSAEEGSAE